MSVFYQPKSRRIRNRKRKHNGFCLAVRSRLFHTAFPEINEKVNMKEQETMASAIRNIMESFGVGMEKAMDTLKIPPEQRSVYASLVRRM